MERVSSRRPLVTVLITAYNEADYIEDAVRSVLTQTYDNLEAVVINDGSSDGTEDVLSRSFEDERLRVFNRERNGRVTSLNYGLDVASGAFVAMLDADDRCKPTRIKKQVSFLRKNKEVGVVGTDYIRIDKIRGESHIRGYPEEDRRIRKEMSKYIPIAHSSVMFRRRAVESVGDYNRDLYGHEDLELWIRVAHNWKLANIPEPLVVRHIRSDSYWHRNFGAHARNAHLAKLNARAVAELSLPFYYYAFPIARLAYSWLPVPLKRITRRLVSDIEEQDLEESPQITPS